MCILYKTLTKFTIKTQGITTNKYHVLCLIYIRQDWTICLILYLVDTERDTTDLGPRPVQV
jgi:hypothetical protein